MNFYLKCYFIIMGCLVFLSFGCQNSSNNFYPPSNYIGICGKIGKYSNGELPGKEKQFTGYWQQFDYNGNIIMEGAYKNGIPVGIWKDYHSYNKLPSCIVTYFSDGKYDEKNYYPDGMIQSQTKGTYRFAANSYSTIPKQKKCWDFDGNIIHDTSRSNVIFFAEGNEPVEIFNSSSTLQDYHLRPYFLAKGDHFELKVFLIPFKTNTDDVVLTEPLTFLLKGKVNPASGKVEISETYSEGFNTFKLDATAIKDSCLWFSFSIPELAEPVNKFSVGIILK